MRVFVSSTYLDLHDHRKNVDEIINRLEAQYKGMEYFGSRPFEPKKVCFDEISKCDVFIGIYAHRYGFIAEGDILSITEQEFDFAQSLEIPCYCYVVNPSYPWPPQLIETESAPRLQKLLRKVNKLVRSTFTSPDNLAKQVAADLVTALQQPFFDSSRELQARVQTLSWQEIANTIGPKYIRELYVNRTLNTNIRDYVRKQVKLDQRISNTILEIGKELDSLHKTLLSVQIYEKDPKKVKKEKAKTKSEIESEKEREREQKKLDETRGILEIGCEVFNSLGKLESTDKDLCFPAPRLTQHLKDISGALSYPMLPTWLSEAERRKAIAEGAAAKKISPSIYWDKRVDVLHKEIDEIIGLIKPIYLIIDRAGGGKTNLLCNLTENLGKNNICFFLAAKSIINPSEQAITKYLASVYPIGDDPIQIAINSFGKAKHSVIVIIDGINESVDPFSFNAALKLFVRRYYGSNIKFIISCRDIYWNYFEDDWWVSHCSQISRDELHSYTEGEYRKALRLYLAAYHISAHPGKDARAQLHHPLLLRFFCEAYTGSKEKPMKMGQLDHIRLFGLFESYCERKFNQIADRLGLYSGDEVFNFLKGIAQFMLEKKARSLAVDSIAVLSAQEFNERSIRSVDSRYIQILDEDILLEQKPTSAGMTLLVSFVYEEFMEYTMAASIWADLQKRGVNITHKEVANISKELLQVEEKFISVLGIIFYIGNFLTKYESDEGLMFIDWLIGAERESIACRMMAEWPIKQQTVFKKLTNLHASTTDSVVRKEAWHAIEKIYIDYWDDFIKYLGKIKFSRSFRPGQVYGLLGDAKAVLNPRQRLKLVRWIAQKMQQLSDDFSRGLGTLQDIIHFSKRDWELDQIETAERLLYKVNLGKDLDD